MLVQHHVVYLQLTMSYEHWGIMSIVFFCWVFILDRKHETISCCTQAAMCIELPGKLELHWIHLGLLLMVPGSHTVFHIHIMRGNKSTGSKWKGIKAGVRVWPTQREQASWQMLRNHTFSPPLFASWPPREQQQQWTAKEQHHHSYQLRWLVHPWECCGWWKN
jgi:hypothetical protein